MSQILLIEDSPEYQRFVRKALSHLSVQAVATVREGLEFLRSQPVSLILLDLSLPDRDGYTFLSELRSETGFPKIPVFCLTSRSLVTDKVTAFSLGVDDYLIKPLDPIELKARVDARLAKKPEVSAGDKIMIGALEIDLETHRVKIQNKTKFASPKLTQTEFKLLCALAKRPERVFTRDQLLIAAWGEDARVLDRAVDVHICSLRKKLGTIGAWIEAVPGVGYRLTPDSAPKHEAA